MTSSYPLPNFSSASPTSFKDSPSTSNKFLSISDRLSFSTASSSHFYYPSPYTSLSGVSSTTSLGSESALAAYETPRRTNPLVAVALKHASNLATSMFSPGAAKEAATKPNTHEKTARGTGRTFRPSLQETTALPSSRLLFDRQIGKLASSTTSSILEHRS
ncbi:hypothetical protein EYR41_007688 [Orbilia oligospora]|uniref:Uncharacterized protein n=1 Tax=Orbilia oligospora TaxID=2813651 RepID=A0A7C8KD25_ORBOL|nr:hypothetical protein TWF751_007068 [Orbilia oligospora]TGJ66028.1 hypothetical protein EYR41_007688 [Orbilia oligospora]